MNTAATINAVSTRSHAVAATAPGNLASQESRGGHRVVALWITAG